MGAGKLVMKKDYEAALKEAFRGLQLFTQPSNSNENASKQVEAKTTEAQILMFSGCKDCQTSADAHIDNQATGAMSWALLKVILINCRY
jgi:hypothetical protein